MEHPFGRENEPLADAFATKNQCLHCSICLSSPASQSVCCGEPKCFATGKKCRSRPTWLGTSERRLKVPLKQPSWSTKKLRSPRWAMWRVRDNTARFGSFNCLSNCLWSFFAGPFDGRHGTDGILWHSTKRAWAIKGPSLFHLYRSNSEQYRTIK